MTWGDLVLEDNSDTVMTASGAVWHQCPFIDEKDEGTAEIVWRTNGKTMELHALANYLSGFEGERISHETLTDQIHADLTNQGVDVVRVTTRWQTAGMEVTCSTSPTLAARK